MEAGPDVSDRGQDRSLIRRTGDCWRLISVNVLFTNLGTHLAWILATIDSEAPDHVVGQPRVDGLRGHQAKARGWR